MAQVFQGQSGAPAAPLVQQTVQTAMNQGMLWTKEDCTGIPTGPGAAQLVTTYGGLATNIASKAIAFAGVTGPAAPILLAVGGIISVFGAIFGHHAAKVRQERQIICAVVASINDSLSVIDQAVQQGALTPAQAMGSLDQLYADLQQNVQPILKQDSDHCNAACFILAEARGVIAKRKDQYSQILPPEPPQPSYAQTPVAASSGVTTSGSGGFDLSPMVNSLASSTGLPPWAIWAAGAVLVAKVIE